jgi:maltose/moltooligosaccharide transporter
MEPFRAFVADMLPDEQRARGFSMQSFFIGVGSVAASYLPFVLGRMTPARGSASGRAIPDIVRISFWLGSAAFLTAVMVTIVTTKEYPPSVQERERLRHAKRFDGGEILRSITHMPKTRTVLHVSVLCGSGGAQCFWRALNHGGGVYGRSDLGRVLFGRL